MSMNGKSSDLLTVLSAVRVEVFCFERLEINIILGVTFARFYCDRNTKTAFSRLWGELFRLIPELTGSILKFSAFFPGDPTARLRAILLDAEAPQAQGLQE